MWLVMDSTVKQSIITTALCKYNTIYIHTKSSYTIYRFNNTEIYTWYVIFASFVYEKRSLHSSKGRDQENHALLERPRGFVLSRQLLPLQQELDTVPVMFDVGDTNF